MAFQPSEGYSTEAWRNEFIQAEIRAKRLPTEAHRMPHVISLTASSNVKHPVFFWQLYSILGPRKIEKIVSNFYRRVFSDHEEEWFKQSFSRISGVDRHIATQMSMWIDAFGGGKAYHGGEYRLNFHHENNARHVMNRRGAERWHFHMMRTLEDSTLASDLLTPSFPGDDGQRVKEAIGAFLSFFMEKYAKSFHFNCEGLRFDLAMHKKQQAGSSTSSTTGLEKLMSLTDEEAQGLRSGQLLELLTSAGIDVSSCVERADIIALALSARKTQTEESASSERLCPAASISGPSSPSSQPVDVASLSVGELKKHLAHLGLPFDDCIEKADLVRRALQAQPAQTS